jgi:hypothetical protein
MNNTHLEELEKKIGFPPYGNEDGELLAAGLSDNKLPPLREWIELVYGIPRKLTENSKRPDFSSKLVLCKTYAIPKYADKVKKSAGIVESESTKDSESESKPEPKPKRTELEMSHVHRIKIKELVGIMYRYRSLDKEEREQIAKFLEAQATYMRD